MSANDFSEWIHGEAERMRSEGVLREARVRPAEELSFASNDYLGLRNHPAVVSAAVSALEKHGLGSASARTLSGTLPAHDQIERELADFFGAPSCTLYSSGYLANLGLLSAIAGRHDTLLIDRLAHASLIDAAHLSGAKLVRFKHNDLADLEQCLRDSSSSRRRFVVSETVFSMDGDTAPVEALLETARAHGAVLVLDDAHAIGVFHSGRGLAPAAPDVLRTATLSKSFGAYGGLVLGPADLKPVLQSSSRPFLFNTSLPASVLAGACAALTVIRSTPGLGAEVLGKSRDFRRRLIEGGFDCMSAETQIVPVLIGDTSLAVAFSEALEKRGIFAPAIRRPTVPPGTERLRFSVTLEHSSEDLRRAAEIVREEGRAMGVVA